VFYFFFLFCFQENYYQRTICTNTASQKNTHAPHTPERKMGRGIVCLVVLVCLHKKRPLPQEIIFESEGKHTHTIKQISNQESNFLEGR